MVTEDAAKVVLPEYRTVTGKLLRPTVHQFCTAFPCLSRVLVKKTAPPEVHVTVPWGMAAEVRFWTWTVMRV